MIGDFTIKLRKKHIGGEYDRWDEYTYPHNWDIHINYLGEPFADLHGAINLNINQIRPWVENRLNILIKEFL